MIKTRLAPSPTGFLHVGTLRTALYDYLFAKKNKGKFLLRIEDTDRERYMEGGIENILRSLYWAGIVPDEGVKLDEKEKIVQSGSENSYIQSERLDIYKKYVQELLDKEHAYYCFCSKERLDELRKIQETNKQATGYDGFCRSLTKEQVEEKLKMKMPYVIRMKMPKEGKTKFVDLVRGEVEFSNNLIDDQVLIKTDGFPTYHLAVIVDDHLMKITHIFRGEEWLPSTPKHIVLYSMFGWDVPQFGHFSLLINAQKQKLSKRHGTVAVEDFKAKGYLPEALINFVAFLGWNPGTEKEIFSLAELVEEFDINKVSKAAAFFNVEKLNWYNQQYIKKMNIDEFTKRCIPFLLDAGLLDKQEINEDLFAWLSKVVDLEKERVVVLSEIPEAVRFLFVKELIYESELLVWKKGTKVDTEKKLVELSEFLQQVSKQDWNHENLENKIRNWISEKGYVVGDVLWPLRVALTGQKNSPGPFEVAEVLGKEESINRISKAILYIKN